MKNQFLHFIQNISLENQPKPADPTEQKGISIIDIILLFVCGIIAFFLGVIGYAYYKGADISSLNSVLYTVGIRENKKIMEKIEKNNFQEKTLPTNEKGSNCIKVKRPITKEGMEENKDLNCCPGLDLIWEEGETEEEGFCMDCGNVICEWPENYENCPSDCPKFEEKINEEIKD